MAPKNKENSKRKKQMEDEGDEDYRKRRDRNNQVIYQFCNYACFLHMRTIIVILADRFTGCETIQSEE